MSTLGHSGQSGHGGHGGHGGQSGPGHHGNHGHGHHGHSGGNAMGGGGHQQTWASIFNETRFSGDMIRNPLVGLVAYGMIFLSIVLIICLADNNLLDFAVTQHNEAQAKRAKELAEAETKAEQAALTQSGASQSQDGGQPGAQQSAPQAAPQAAQQSAQQAAQQDLQQASQNLLPPSAPQQSFSPQAPSQPGYLQQSLMQQSQGGYAPQSFAQQGYSQQTQGFSQPAYAAPAPYGAYQPQAVPQGGFAGYPQQPAGGYRHGGYQHSGAYYQGGYKTGPDGTTQVPMNRMVVNR